VNSVNAIAVIGAPVAYGMAFIFLILVVFTDSWAHSLVTVAHEGGHIAMAIATGRVDPQGNFRFHLNPDTGGGGTGGICQKPGIRYILVGFAGYPMPSLLGLGGAALIDKGQTWSVLWAAIVLLIAVFFRAATWREEGGPVTQIFLVMIILGVGWVTVAGSPYLRVVVAVGLVWWLLIGGAHWAVKLSRAERSDAAKLAKATHIPAIVWHFVWGAIGVAILVAGAKLLL
jgi:hypothetical protein